MLRTSLALALALWSCSKPAVSTPADAGASSVTAALTVDPDGGQVVRFVALGDTGKGNPSQYQVGAAIGAHCAKLGCDFVVLLGDNFYQNGAFTVA